LALTLERPGPFAAGEPIGFRVASPETYARIGFYAGDVKIGETSSDTRTWTWNDAPRGFAKVHARAEGTDGRLVASADLNLDIH
jgi:hypothetical protein